MLTASVQMSHTVHDTANYSPIKLIQMHDEVTTRLNDPEWMLEIGPVFRIKITWTGFTFFFDVDENSSEFFSVVREISLKYKTVKNQWTVT